MSSLLVKAFSLVRVDDGICEDQVRFEIEGDRATTFECLIDYGTQRFEGIPVEKARETYQRYKRLGWVEPVKTPAYSIEELRAIASKHYRRREEEGKRGGSFPPTF